MSGVLAEAGWVGAWSSAVEACADWSRLHGHRHRITWSSDQQHWRIACITPPESGRA